MAYDDDDQCFDFEHIWQTGIKCARGVRWKASVQRYELFLLARCGELFIQIDVGAWLKTTGRFFRFTLYERGHRRDIRSTTITERNGQKCLCDYSLVQAIQPSLIYDNGATMKNKGITFAEKRMTRMLCHFIQEVGPEAAYENGYAVLYDFHGYFDSIVHAILILIVDRFYTDRRLMETIHKLISDFGEHGLGLGSQISQILALVMATGLDHAIKDISRIKVYERYMDDGICIVPTKEAANALLSIVQAMASDLKLELNEKKTRIVKLSRGFTFLKIRYQITSTGKIIRHIAKDGTVRMRNRLGAYRKKLDAGKIKLENVEMSMEAYFANCDRANSTRTKLSFWYRFRRMFPESKAFIKKKPIKNIQKELASYQAVWMKAHPNGSWAAFKRDWKAYLKERDEKNDVLQISLRRVNR